MSVGMGVIGAGVWGNMHCTTYSRIPNAELVAVCDIVPEKAKEYAEKYGAKRWYTDYREMLADPEIDAVGVVTPDYAHKQPVLDACAAGKHVLVEKPMATSLEDAIEMNEAAEKAGVILMPDFHNRWNPCFVTAMESIQDGSLGPAKYISIRHADTKYVPFHMLSWSDKSSVHWFLGAHSVDLARFIMGSEVNRVYTVERRGILERAGIDTPDFFTTIMEFENGGVATIENSWIHPDVMQDIGEFRAEILCEKGMHSVGFNTADTCITFSEEHGRPYMQDLYAENIVYGQLKGFCFDSIIHFVNCVERGETPMVTGLDGVENTRTLEAMTKSLASGKPVEVIR